MKTTAMTALIIALTVSPALAISRYNPKTLTCESAQAAIHDQGAVIYRYTSPRGLPLYDRYVRNSRYCEGNEYADWTSIPTKDNPKCQVLNCQKRDNIDDRLFIPNHNL